MPDDEKKKTIMIDAMYKDQKPDILEVM